MSKEEKDTVEEELEKVKCLRPGKCPDADLAPLLPTKSFVPRSAESSCRLSARPYELRNTPCLFATSHLPIQHTLQSPPSAFGNLSLVSRPKESCTCPYAGPFVSLLLQYTLLLPHDGSRTKQLNC